ncbi:hypothetical protein [Pseudomonas orientalis]|nr:hypothetical protein [Pseudomonas orientalis]
MNYYTAIRYKGRESLKETMTAEEKTALMLDHSVGYDIEQTLGTYQTKIYLKKDGKRVLKFNERKISTVVKAVRLEFVCEEIDIRDTDLKNAMIGSKAYYAMKSLYERIDSTIQENKEFLEKSRII